MSQYLYLTDLAYVYLGLLIAFSIAQVLLLRPGNRLQIYLWLAASLFSAIGTAFAPHLLTVVSVSDFGVWGGLAALFGGVLRFFSLSYRTRSFQRRHLAMLFLGLTLLGMPFAALPPLAPYRLLISSLVGASISAACFTALLQNRVWRSINNLGLHMSLLGMGLSAAALIWRALTSYPFGDDQAFVGESVLQRHAMELLVLISFFLQVGFTGMIIARQGQEDMFADRRAIRITQRTARLRRRSQEVAAISRERLNLVQLLTHEVRQPISNAQASLQSISLFLQNNTNVSQKATVALQRAQSSLDSITLALSNIIVASTLVSDERKWNPQTIDAFAILEMARLDCNLEQQNRIVAKATDQHVYLVSVSILLRVALQNILDQAIKLSVPGREINAVLALEAEQGMVVYDVHFTSDKIDILQNDVFERRRSSDTQRSGTSSLGLFVVRQVARELAGDVRLWSPGPGQLCFKLSLPY